MNFDTWWENHGKYNLQDHVLGAVRPLGSSDVKELMKLAFEVGAEAKLDAVAAERERCAKIVDVPPGTEAWEVIGGEEGLTMLRELAAQIRGA